MIRVTIEMVPHGIENRKHTLHVGEIFNTGTGDANSGNYGVRLYDKGGRLWKTGSIEGFPRKHRLAWDLLLWALVAAGLADRVKQDAASPSAERASVGEAARV